jgi:hypothetical protein
MLRGHLHRRWLTNRIAFAGSALVATAAFLAVGPFLPYVAGLAIVSAAHLVSALWRWRRRAEGFEITPLGVRSALTDFMGPQQLDTPDITRIETNPGTAYITLRTERKDLTINWDQVELETGERLTPVEAVLRMTQILGVPAFTVHVYHEPTPLRSLEDAYDAPIPTTWREIFRNVFSFRRRKLKPAPERDQP